MSQQQGTSGTQGINALNPPPPAQGGQQATNVTGGQQPQQPPQQPAGNQQALQDLLNKLQADFETQAQQQGLTLPTGGLASLINTAPPSVGSSASVANLQAGFGQFNQNAPPFAGNAWGTAGAAIGPLSLSAPNTPARSGFRSRNEFERVTGDIPIEKFSYGTANANWIDWASRFEKAVQVATNAHGRDRLEEICLLWISLKLNDEAQPIYAKCEHKDKSWPLLKAELGELFEDPKVQRLWARNMDAYKKPAEMSLQVYRANIIGLVHKYSPILIHDKKAYNQELYNRFVNGLPKDWKDYLDESIPFEKENLEAAYSQAVKYESLKERKDKVNFSAAAMSDAKKDGVRKMRRDLEKVKSQISKQLGGRRSDSSTEGSSSQSEDDLRAIQTADEDSDDYHKALVKSTSEAVAQALAASLKNVSIKPKSCKKSSHSKED